MGTFLHPRKFSFFVLSFFFFFASSSFGLRQQNLSEADLGGLYDLVVCTGICKRASVWMYHWILSLSLCLSPVWLVTPQRQTVGSKLTKDKMFVLEGKLHSPAGGGCVWHLWCRSRGSSNPLPPSLHLLPMSLSLHAPNKALRSYE